MKDLNLELDSKVDVRCDDRGRIVLLPHDDRSPVRVDSEVWSDVAAYREGRWCIDPAPEGEADRRRRTHLVSLLDQQGMILGRRVPPGRGTVRWRALTRGYDGAARMLAAPLVRGLSPRARAGLLFGSGALAVAALPALWIGADGRMFVELVNRNWWIGLAGFFFLFPLIHEFSHAFAARLFQLPVSAVGVQLDGGLRCRPFVRVRDAVLTSRPEVRVLLPLVGVICNLWIALAAGIAFVAAPEGSLGRDIAGVVVGLAHLKVILDGGFGTKSDATQALRLADEFADARIAKFLRVLMRGGIILFILSTALMLALSAGVAGAGAAS